MHPKILILVIWFKEIDFVAPDPLAPTYSPYEMNLQEVGPPTKKKAHKNLRCLDLRILARGIWAL